MKMKEIASVIRSKNSGPYELTMDLMFPNDDVFEKVVASNVISRERIAEIYQLKAEEVLSIVIFPKARAIKATIVRPMASGALGERDVYGAQQHAPLMDLEVEL
ncbi:MAG: DUF4387 domain-containing protein [Oscillospiraceae bacterium]|nr:DUF4387 domain-containing protein [Oscillospiraceae bacterium]